MSFPKRAQTGKIVNKPQGGGASKSGIPSSIGRNRQLVFKLKSRVHQQYLSMKAIKGRITDGPISGATVRLKELNRNILAITTTDTNGNFSFNSDTLEPNTYYLLESSSGTDTVTNLQIEVNLTLLMKTGIDKTANVVVSPVSTILKEMIDNNSSSLSSLTTTQIDALISDSKNDLNKYLNTGNDSINNIETTNFFTTNNVDLYKENSAIYAYLRTTYEIEQNTYDERYPITELITVLSTGTITGPQSISALLTSESTFTKYSDKLTINADGDTLTTLINDISSSTSITSLNSVLQNSYNNAEYPKQYDLQLIKDISGVRSAGLSIDTTGRFLSYAQSVNRFFIRDLSNDVILLDVSGITGSQVGYDMTGNDQFIVAASNISSSSSEFGGKGYVLVYKKTTDFPYWSYMTTISGETVRDDFGFGMSIYNNELMVSSRNRNYSDVSGQVQIFSLNANNNTFARIFDISGDIPTSLLGVNNGCSIHQNYAAIGSSRSGYLSNSSPIKCGKVIVLKKNNGNWSKMMDVYPPEKYITGVIKGHYNSNGTIKDPSGLDMFFGFSVGITNTHLAVGAYYYSDMSGNTVLKNRCGAVFLYELSGNSCEYVTTFLGDDNRGDYGYDIQISDDFLVVGANRTNSNIPGNNHLGSVYIYEKGPYNTWGFKKKLQHPRLGETSPLTKTFGYKVDLKENNLVITDVVSNVYVYKKVEI